MWTPRIRTAALALADPIKFDKLTLVERYGPPDTLIIEGDIEDLRPAFDTSSGIVVWDDDGTQRFSGRTPQNPKGKIERRGNETATLTYEADTVVLWKRYCWPTPAVAWTAQTTAYDVQTAVHETRIIGYITRNAGSTAYNSGTFDRRVPNIRIPATAGRGTSATTSARFQNLGQLVAELAEAASLRVTLKQTYDGGVTPFIDVVIDSVPDYSAWARFGDAETGDLGILGEEWRYAVGGGPNVILSAAAGELANRSLTFLQDNSRKTAWGDHEEFFIDQRGTTDAGEISAGLATAMAENAPLTEVEAPIESGDLIFGPAAGSIPVGAKVTASLDGVAVVERIRQLTTTVNFTEGEPTVSVEPVVGTPDSGLTIDQKKLREALARIKKLEASL